VNGSDAHYNWIDFKPIMSDYVALPMMAISTFLMFQSYGARFQSALGDFMAWILLLVSPLLLLMNFGYAGDSIGALAAEIMLPVAVLSMFRKPTIFA
jgi:hypothetical protein